MSVARTSPVCSNQCLVQHGSDSPRSVACNAGGGRLSVGCITRKGIEVKRGPSQPESVLLPHIVVHSSGSDSAFRTTNVRQPLWRKIGPRLVVFEPSGAPI